ncbi:MAG: secretion protein EspA [Parashewanella sp.]
MSEPITAEDPKSSPIAHHHKDSDMDNQLQNIQDFIQSPEFSDFQKVREIKTNLIGVSSIIDVDRELAQKGDSVLSGGIAILYLFMNLLSELANQKYLEMQQKAKVARDTQDKANEINELIAKVAKQGDEGKVALPKDVIDYMRENGIHIDGKSIDKYLTDIGGTEGKDSGYKYINLTLTSPSGKTLKLNYTSGEYFTEQGAGIWPNHNADGSISYIQNGETYTGKAVDPDDQLVLIQLDKGQLESVKAALENVSNRASDFVSQSQLQLQKVMQTYNVSVSLLNSMQTMLEEMNKAIAQNVR